MSFRGGAFISGSLVGSGNRGGIKGGVIGGLDRENIPQETSISVNRCRSEENNKTLEVRKPERRFALEAGLHEGSP